MGIVIAYLFGFVLSDYTGLGMTGSLFETDAFTGRKAELKNLILPAFTLGIRPLAIITQLTRSSMLDVLNQEQFLLNSRVSLVCTQRDQLVAAFQLLASMGKLTAADLGLSVTLYDPTKHYDSIFWQPIGTNSDTKNDLQTRKPAS